MAIIIINLNPHSTGRRFRYAHGDLGFSLNYTKSPRKRRQPHNLGTWRFRYASTTLPLRYCYDSTTTMKIWLRLVYANGDEAATLLRPWRWSYAFVALLYPYYIESEIPMHFYYDLGASTMLLLRCYCAFAVFATIRVILTKISNRSGIAVQWNGGLSLHPVRYTPFRKETLGGS